MAVKKKRTPTLAQVRKLAKEKLGEDTYVALEPVAYGWSVRAFRYGSDCSALSVIVPKKLPALRALYAALEAL